MFWLLLPAYQQSTKTVEPTVAALNDPPPRLLPRLPCQVFGLLTAPTNVGGKAEFLHNGADLVIGVPFVQTYALWLAVGRVGSCDHDTFDCGTHELHIVAVCAINHHADRDALPLGQQRAFDAVFAAVGRIGSGLFPPQVAL